MRLIGVALLAFILAGLLVILGQGGAFKAGWNKLSGNDQRQFSNYERAVKRGYNIAGTDVFTTGQDSDAPLILSGLPSYSSQLFRLPVDSRPINGRYDLVFSSRVAQGVEGALRVSINGVKRADILLDQNSSQQKVGIELTAGELSSGVLDVRLSLQGRGPIAECTPDDSIAAVVEIKPESGLQLELTKAVETTRDKLALWGGRIPVLWNDGKNNADSLVSIVHSARLVQKGYSLHLGEEGLDSEALTKLSGEAQTYNNIFIPAAYPIPLTGKSVNRGARKFDRQTSWYYHYDTESLPELVLPSALDMRLAVGPAGGDMRYDATVTLNGHMLFARRLPLQTERLSQSISLPAALHQAENRLEISLASVDINNIRCGTNSQSIAEILPETVLRGGGQKASDNLSALRAKLSAVETVALTGQANTAVDAQEISKLLAQLGPRGLSFVKNTAPANIRIITGDLVSAIRANSAQRDNWIVYRSLDPNVGITARPISEIGSLSGPAVALLISISENESAARKTGSSG